MREQKKFPAFKINQNIIDDNPKEINLVDLFIGKATFEELYSIVFISNRKEEIHSKYDDESLEGTTLNEDVIHAFQRHQNPTRISEIINFIKNENPEGYPNLMPGSVILWFNCKYTSHKNVLNFREDYLPFCYFEENHVHLETFENSKEAFIVDGQHRYLALEKEYLRLKQKTNLSDEEKEELKKIKNFEFPITFILGGDIYYLAKVFADVNFEQKRVNKSLYYDIFGTLPGKKNKLRLSHNLVVHLNNNDKSPLKNMFNLTGAEKGLISQNSFISLIRHYFNRGNIWEDYYISYINEDNLKDIRIISRFFRAYFKSISKKFKDYWIERDSEGNIINDSRNISILCKTTGFGAFLRLIKDIFPLVEEESEEKMEININKIFEKISDDNAYEYFSDNSIFKGGGSYGAQGKLYLFLKRDLQLPLSKKEQEKLEHISK